MGTKLYWINGPWPGKLALAARPRGGDWLEQEMIEWRRSGTDEILSLLTAKEEKDLVLQDEAKFARAQGMKFISFPIEDRQVPASASEVTSVLEAINSGLASGKNLVIHCRQGIGRSGLMAACLLVSQGCDPGSAVKHLSAERGISIPETREQRHWIEHYASTLAGKMNV
jgi:Predicted protein-tyrosine phosphatase